MNIAAWVRFALSPIGPNFLQRRRERRERRNRLAAIARAIDNPADAAAEEQNPELVFQEGSATFQILQQEYKGNFGRQILAVAIASAIVVPVAFAILSFSYFRTRPSDPNLGLGTRIVFSTVRFSSPPKQEEIYFTSGATEAEARRLGQFFQEGGLFDGKMGWSIQLSRQDEVYIVSFVMRFNAWDDPVVVDAFRELGQELSQRVFQNKPVKIHLCEDAIALSPLGGSCFLVRRVIE
jgi:hypothetical protein